MIGQPRRYLRILIVAPKAIPYDAISMAARNSYRMLAAHPDFDVAFITSDNGFDDVPARLAMGVMELMSEPAFKAADVIIYHFGIYHQFLDALLIGNGHARQVVRFHNITPREFVDAAVWPVIDLSFRQLHNLRHAELIWADSQVNADVLIERGIDRSRIEVLPLVVDHPEPARLGQKPAEPIELLFVGRMVQSKGLLDCIEALSLAAAGGAPPLRLTVVGSARFSDKRYAARCQDLIAKLGLEQTVAFLGTVDDKALGEAYRKAHVLMIPSYHEGFCMPVIEGLRAGCVPLGYTAGNLPSIAAGLGCLVPTGDVPALADGLRRMADGIARSIRAPDLAALPLDSGAAGVADFDARAKDYVRGFGFERVTAMTIQSTERLMAGA